MLNRDTAVALPQRPEDTARAVNAVRRMMRSLRLAAGAIQSDLGMSAAQLYVLGHLEEAKGQSIQDLAVRTLTDRSSVAAVVERLVAQGLAQRTRSEGDRRRADIRLTARGYALLADAPPAPTALLREALDALPRNELRRLTTSLERLVTAMGAETTVPQMLFDDEAAES